MKVPKGLAARAVLEMEQGRKLYIEIKDGSNFQNFYTTYIAQGSGRGRIVEPGSPRHRGFASGIEDAVARIEQVLDLHAKRTGRHKVIRKKVWIFRKRLYKQRLCATPDELGLTHVNCLFPHPRRRTQ